jgi:hypothetical protein
MAPCSHVSKRTEHLLDGPCQHLVVLEAELSVIPLTRVRLSNRGATDFAKNVSGVASEAVENLCRGWCAAPNGNKVTQPVGWVVGRWWW